MHSSSDTDGQSPRTSAASSSQVPASQTIDLDREPTHAPTGDAGHWGFLEEHHACG
jgi:hypothetical protein